MARVKIKKDTAVDKTRKIKRESEQRRRDRIKENPELYEEMKRKERDRYYRRKQEGKIKIVSDLTDREKRAQRKNWVQKKRKSREKMKNQRKLQEHLLNATPPESGDNDSEIIGIQNNIAMIGRAGSSRKNIGRKAVNRNKTKAYKRIKLLEKVLHKERQEKLHFKKGRDKYKKRLQRFINANKNLNSPKHKIHAMLKGEKVSPKVRKFLEFGSALTTQIEENFEKNFKSRKSKRAFGLVLSGKIIKKYKCMHKVQIKSYWKRLCQNESENGIFDAIKRSTKYMTRNEMKVKADVVRFLEQDDNSRVEPGVKDFKSKNGVKKQKRTLNASLKSLHKKIEVEFGYNVPYSTFCASRPFWVCFSDYKKRNTCVCEKHDNFDLIFTKLKQLRIIQYQDSDQMIKSLCCENVVKTKEECLGRKCEKCLEKVIIIQEFEDKVTNVDQWVRKKISLIIRGNKKQMVKVVKENKQMSTKDLVGKLIENIPKFMQHVYNIVHQYKALRDIKKQLTKNEILLHVDFSQNYDCKYSREIQSVHFGGSHEQVTLHTGVVYYRDSSEDIRVLSFCSLSESLRHDPSAICAHLKKILTHVQTVVTEAHTIHFLSDSPSTQYRNKTMFQFMLTYLRKFCTMALTWNYSESGHGKGAPDGIGGTLKRTANRLVGEGTDIPNFREFVKVLSREVSNVKLFIVTKEEIEEIDAFIPPNILPFTGTMQVHQAVWSCIKEDRLELRCLTCNECAPGSKCAHFYIGVFEIGKSAKSSSNSILLHVSV